MSAPDDNPDRTRPREVGPVVIKGPLGEAVLAAVRALNPEARFVDRGAYVRVLCPGRCVLERAAVETQGQRPFRLPSDLEAVMPSFKGRFTVTDDQAVWEAGS